MLAFALIFALTAHSALAKPSNYCIFPCDSQSGSSGAYTQPGYGQAGSGFGQTGSSFGQTGSGFGQTGNGFGQTGSGFGQTGSGFGQTAGSNFGQNSFRNMFSGMGGMSGKLEDFGTVPVQQPTYQRAAYQPHVYSQPQQTEVVHQQHQIPVQPAIDAMFTHSSGKASYETNNGFYKFSQPAITNTVISEPIRQQPMQMRPARICQNYYEPCQ